MRYSVYFDRIDHIRDASLILTGHVEKNDKQSNDLFPFFYTGILEKKKKEKRDSNKLLHTPIEYEKGHNLVVQQVEMMMMPCNTR
jgi:hypothetical protein